MDLLNPLNWFNNSQENNKTKEESIESIVNEDGITPFSSQTRIELPIQSDNDEDLKQEIKRLKTKNANLKENNHLLLKELREVKDNNSELKKLRKKLDSNLAKEKNNYKSLEEKLHKEFKIKWEQNSIKAKQEFESKLRNLEREIKYYN